MNLSELFFPTPGSLIIWRHSNDHVMLSLVISVSFTPTSIRTTEFIIDERVYGGRIGRMRSTISCFRYPRDHPERWFITVVFDPSAEVR